MSQRKYLLQSHWKMGKTLNSVEEVEKVWIMLSIEKLQTWDKNHLNMDLKLTNKGFFGRQNLFSLPIENYLK